MPDSFQLVRKLNEAGGWRLWEGPQQSGAVAGGS
jgi:hypothetical protein